MKTLEINIQTILFISDSHNTILGCYNRNTKVLAYNKPICSDVDMLNMKEELDSVNEQPESLFQTDLFGVNFYDHTTGGTSEFHEVAKYKARKDYYNDLYNI